MTDKNGVLKAVKSTARMGGRVAMLPMELKTPATMEYTMATPIAAAMPASPPRLPMETAKGTARMAMTRVVRGSAIFL